MWREKTPENFEQIEPELLGRQLMRSFYISFALSQGLVSPQVKLLGLSSAYYQSTYGRQTTVEASETIDQDFIENLNIPNNHKTIDMDVYQAAEFKNRWADYQHHLNRPHHPYNLESKNYQTRVSMILGDIASRDLYYLEPQGENVDRTQPGRGRSSKKDPYKSFFRDHVLAGKSTGDPNAFDPILAGAASLFDPSTKLGRASQVQLRGLQNYTLPRLAYAWENSHPGQEFADAEQITNPSSLRIARLASDLTK